MPSRDDRDLGVALVESLVDEGVEAEAVAQDEVGVGDGAQLAGRGLEVVRVLVGLEDAR